MSDQAAVAVRYIGRKANYVDRLYKSGLTFVPGQERAIPAALAQRFLRHGDSFELVTPTGGEQPVQTDPNAGANSQLDDTQKLLDEAAKRDLAEKDRVAKLMDLKDQVNQMEKDAVQAFAREKYDHAIPKTLSLENMRAKAIGLIDEYGAV